MNVTVYMDIPHTNDHDHESCRELAGLVENMLATVDQMTLKDLGLHINPNAYFKAPEVFLTYKSFRLAHIGITKDTREMRVSYFSKTKMGRLITNFAYVPLVAPGSIERIQEMVQKSVQVYVKWAKKPAPPPKPAKSKQKTKFRVAYRRR